METIDILRDERELLENRLAHRQRPVTVVGLYSGHQLTAPVVPLPDDFGIGQESVHTGKIFGAKLGPQPFIAAKCGNPRFSRDTRPGQS